MICHKNLSLICFCLSFCLLKRDKKTFSLVQKIFLTNKNVFLSPFDKKTPKKWRVFVTNHVTYFCDRLTELALCSTLNSRIGQLENSWFYSLMLRIFRHSYGPVICQQGKILVIIIGWVCTWLLKMNARWNNFWIYVSCYVQFRLLHFQNWYHVHDYFNF